MKSPLFLMRALAIGAIAALGAGLSLAAQTEDEHAPKIHLFDAPDAGKGPGSPFCYLACPGTTAYGINSQGALTGYYVDDSNLYHGFVRTPDGHLTEFDPPGAGTLPGSAQGTVPASINDAGEIAGQYQDGGYLYHGFVRHPNGRFETIDAPGAGTGAGQGTWAQVINQWGEVAGYYLDAGNNYHGFIRYPGGAIRGFEATGAGTGPGQGTIVAGPSGNSLNSEGAVTGWYIDSGGTYHGFVMGPWDGATTTIDVPGAAGTYGDGINSEGVISGFYLDSSIVVHSFVLVPHGKPSTYDAPGAGTAADQFIGTFSVGINDSGVIAGYTTDNGFVDHGFMRSARGAIKIIDIPGTGTGAGQGTTIFNLNLFGQTDGVYTDGQNVNHGFIRDADCEDVGKEW
jgi:hypothetical protein